jgi:hypothetical protein
MLLGQSPKESKDDQNCGYRIHFSAIIASQKACNCTASKPKPRIVSDEAKKQKLGVLKRADASSQVKEYLHVV